jgi:hypothetical protein
MCYNNNIRFKRKEKNMKYAELKTLMVQKGFEFENYGKFIKKDGHLLVSSTKDKTRCIFEALNNYFLNENISKISQKEVNKYFNSQTGSFDWEKMLKELI